MTCRETQPLLSPFFDGELDPAQMRSVEQHRTHCLGCAQELEQLSRLHEVMRVQTIALVEEIDLGGLWRGIEARIATMPPEPFGRRVGAWLRERLEAWPVRMPVLAGSAAAAVAVLVWIGPFAPSEPPTIDLASVDNSAIVNSLDSHVGSVTLLNDPETNTSVLWVKEDGPDPDFAEFP